MIMEIFAIIIIFSSAYLYYVWSLESIEKKKRVEP